MGETSVDTAVDLNEDNQACIKLAHNPCSAQRTKSMDVKYHFLRQAVQEGKINLKYVDTKNQLADIFTKQLPEPQFVNLRTAIGRRGTTGLNDLEWVRSLEAPGRGSGLSHPRPDSKMQRKRTGPRRAARAPSGETRGILE